MLRIDSWGDSTSFSSALSEAWHELEHAPPGAGWVVAIAYALTEAFHVAVAIVFAPWGARDEPLWHSFRNALRQAWLHTAHFLPAIALIGGFVLVLEGARESWYAAHSSYPRGTYFVTNAPWYVSTPAGPMIAFVGALSAAWVVFALARAIGAPRRASRSIRPPLCTPCGYNLTAIPINGRCPECGSAVTESLGVTRETGMPPGLPSCLKCNAILDGVAVDGRCPQCLVTVAHSLGSGRQVGTAWEQRSRGFGGMIASWRRTASLAFRDPESFGRILRLAKPVGHRSFLALYFPLIFLIAAAALLVHILRFEINSNLLDKTLAFACLMGTFGIICAIAAFAAVNLLALVIGLLESWLAKRNMLPAAAQVACYLASVVIAWEVLGAVLILLITTNEEFFRSLENATGVYRDMLAAAAFFVPNLCAVSLYLYLIARGTKAARYANK